MIWNLFKKDENSLNKQEKEAALILKDIVYGKSIGEPDYIPNGITNLSMGLYYLSFKRANRKPVRLEDLRDPLAIIKNPKALNYINIFKNIKDSLENLTNNPLVLRREISVKEYEQTILTLLNFSRDEIKKI